MRYFILIITVFIFSACNKALDVGTPTDRIVTGAVYSSDATAAAVLTGLYYNMSNGGPFSGAESLSFNCGLSADEFELVTEDMQLRGVWQNALTPAYAPFWSKLYNYIFVANAALEGVGNAMTLTAALKQQLTGEALFIRSLCYWYLVNVFGEVPLVTTTDAQVNKYLSRSSVDNVYEQIIADLNRAKPLLSNSYLKADGVSGSVDRFRPTRWAAYALLSRVYLSLHNWAGAVVMADSVISHQELFNMVTLDQAFLKNNQGAIWQLEPVGVSYTQDGALFNLMQPVYISGSLMGAFEQGDKRMVEWLRKDDNYIPAKYKVFEDTKVVTECTTILRISEVILNKAEADAELGDLSSARASLNIIRAKAGLPDITGGNKESLLVAIHRERRIELFSEMGFRWLDLKRTGAVDTVMMSAAATKGGIWFSYQKLYPIPASERQLDPQLTQNNGY